MYFSDSCILYQSAIWRLICVTDTFLPSTNLCRRRTFSPRQYYLSRHLTLSCPVSLRPKSICVRRLKSGKDFICQQKKISSAGRKDFISWQKNSSPDKRFHLQENHFPENKFHLLEKRFNRLAKDFICQQKKTSFQGAINSKAL